MQTPEIRPFGEVAFSVLLLVLSVWTVWAAYQISGFGKLSDPGTVPLIGGTIMLISSGINAFKCIRRRNMLSGSFRTDIAPTAVIVFSAAGLAYVIALESLGFITASVIYLTALFYVLAKQRPLRAFALSVGSVVLIYLVFRLVFLVLLPEGIIPERAIMAVISDRIAGR